MKKNREVLLFSILTILCFSLLQFFDPAFIRDHIESKTYDLRLKLRNDIRPPKISNDIAIVVIDEQSLAEYGRWPWSRKVMADLLNKITAGKPKVIGIDIMFSERETEEADQALAEAIRKGKRVVLATAFMMPETKSKAKKTAAAVAPPDFLWDSAFMEVKTIPGIAWKDWAVKADKVLPPLEEFARAATLGHVTSPNDQDGILRWEILSVSLGDDNYPSLALQVARLAAHIPPQEVVLYGGSGIKFGERMIATDLSGRVLINYMGREQSYNYLSAADLLSGKIPPQQLQGKIVLVGTSALATYDQKATPFSADMPGVEKNATVVQNILENNFIRKSPGIFELVIILVTGILLTVALPRLNATRGVLLASSLIVAYLVVACWLLVLQGLWLNLVLPAGNMAILFTTATISRLRTEEKRAKEIRAMFSSYVSPKIVEQLINNPDRFRLGGERRNVTVLFSDMIGFTTLSEKLAPEEVVNMLNEYYKEMAEIIFHWDGTLDKFVGDEIMAIWGAPTDQPNHAELAVRCALHMSDRLTQMQDQWRSQGRDIVDCGIGINTGDCLIGNIGLPGKKMDYTAIGNHVNIAARVEKQTREYGTRILITGETFDAIKPSVESGAIGHTEFHEEEWVKVKGKDEAVLMISVKSLPPDHT